MRLENATAQVAARSFAAVSMSHVQSAALKVAQAYAGWIEFESRRRAMRSLCIFAFSSAVFSIHKILSHPFAVRALTTKHRTELWQHKRSMIATALKSAYQR